MLLVLSFLQRKDILLKNIAMKKVREKVVSILLATTMVDQLA